MEVNELSDQVEFFITKENHELQVLNLDFLEEKRLEAELNHTAY